MHFMASPRLLQFQGNCSSPRKARISKPRCGLLANALAFVSMIFAGSTLACDSSGFDPVDPVFCNPYQVTPPASPYVEINAQAGYGVHVLADGTRITLDFARGTFTTLFSNGAIHVASVSQLDASTQEQFWKAARFVAENPHVAFNLPLDQIQYGIDRANAAISQPKLSGAWDDKEPYCRPAVDKVLPCVEVTAPTYYFSWFTENWRLARPGEFFEAGTIFCPYGDNYTMCADYLRQHRDNWEAERKQSCVVAGLAGGAALFTGAQAAPVCFAFGASLLGTTTGPGAVSAPVVPATGAACLVSGGLTLFAALTFQHELAKCEAKYPGPRPG